MDEVTHVFSWIEKLGIGNVLTVVFVWFFIKPFLEKHLKLIDTLTSFINEELRPVLHIHKAHVDNSDQHHRDTADCKIHLGHVVESQKKSLNILSQLAIKQGITVIE